LAVAVRKKGRWGGLTSFPVDRQRAHRNRYLPVLIAGAVTDTTMPRRNTDSLVKIAHIAK
jgi:hypothetical protein